MYFQKIKKSEQELEVSSQPQVGISGYQDFQFFFQYQDFQSRYKFFPRIPRINFLKIYWEVKSDTQ